MPVDLNKAPLFAFIGNARGRFPSTTKAITELRKLGKPPVSADLTQPTREIEIARDVFEYLACMTTHATPLTQTRRQAALHIQKQWSSSVRPWVLFFLDHIARTPDISENPQGTRFMDNVVTATAFVIMYPAALKDPFPELDQLRTSQALLTLSIEVWLRVIDIHHFSWHTWTELLVKILFPKYIGQSFTPSFPRALAASRRKDDFELVCIRHLNRLSQRPWEIPDDELSGYTLSMTLFCQCFFPTSPSYFPFLRAGATPAITSALISLLSRKQTLEDVPSDTERFNIVVDLAEKLIMLLRLLIEAPAYVFQALDLGILVAFFKAERFHHLKTKSSFPPLPSFNGDSQSTFHGLFSNLMEQCAMYMLYPPVLRQFRKSIEKIEYRGLDVRLHPKSEPFWSTWMKCRERAETLNAIYHNVRIVAPGNMCGYKSCPLKYGPGGRRQPLPDGHRYLRCTACLSRIYCSRSCAVKNWKEEHRAQCAQIVATKKAGKNYPSNTEMAFFCAIYEHHVFHNRSNIVEGMQAHEAGNRDKDPLKSCFLELHLDKTEVLDPLSSDCSRLSDLSSLDCSDMPPALLHDLHTSLVSAYESPAKICVLTYIPNGDREVMSLVKAVDMSMLRAAPRWYTATGNVY